VSAVKAADEYTKFIDQVEGPIHKRANILALLVKVARWFIFQTKNPTFG
jgi:hypothetical protein